MAVKIRLTRIGKKRQPSYRVVVADSRGPRDGRYIEQIGRYDPRQEPSLVEIDNERAAYWLSQGPNAPSQEAIEIAGTARRPRSVRPTFMSSAPRPQPGAGDHRCRGDREEAAAPAAAAERRRRSARS
jgi:small subunit ribosomal protein S16